MMASQSPVSALPPHRHPFAASAKGDSHPQYFIKSASERLSNAVLNSPAFKDQQQTEAVTFPPDEERGRKFRPSLSAPAAVLSVAPVERSSTSTFTRPAQPTALAAEEDWAPGFAGDSWGATFQVGQPFTGETGDVTVSRELRAAGREADRQRGVWETALQKALDEGRSETSISLHGQSLTQIPASVGDLAKLVSLPTSPPRSRPRDFQRTSTGAPTRPFIRNDNLRDFRKTASAGLILDQPRLGNVDIKLYLSSNDLTADSLSHALFSVTSISCLSLRQNLLLNRLPPAVGRLTNLVELNLAGTSIQFLPAELLLLTRLENLLLPNTLPTRAPLEYPTR
ncbi:hypothetical protein P7C70_g6856, partial [Phenoliferia sp. Uapishka_3]